MTCVLETTKKARKQPKDLDLLPGETPLDMVRRQGWYAPPDLDEVQRAGIPLVVSYGGGVDSTAVLVEMQRRGIRPDLILFAETYGERPETYRYIEDVMQPWLRSVGFPQISRVTIASKHAGLEAQCLATKTLPSLAYGGHSCSLKWKASAQSKTLNRHELTKGFWKRTKADWGIVGRAIRVIGYDASPADLKRVKKAAGKDWPKFRFWYPLIDWNLTRERCVALIAGAGLPVPVKSSCFFCPAMKKDEIRDLARVHPELVIRALLLEKNAAERNTTVAGLGRSWSWTSLVLEEELLPISLLEAAGILPVAR